MRYSIGDSFPEQFWIQQYFINDFAGYGLQAPPPGYQWVRFGPDLMLVNLGNGAIAQVAYGAFAGSQSPNGGYNGQ
jgi:Ni/Co efflux regulator RcnB